MEIIPYIPPAIESCIEGEWSWYGHAPAEPLGRPQPVRERLPRQDIRAAARDAGDEGAVGRERIEERVEVHRVRPVEGRIEVLEVHEHGVPDARRIVGPGMPSLSPTTAERLTICRPQFLVKRL